MHTPQVFEIPCTCGKSYIRQTERSIETHIREHVKNIDYKRMQKSVVAELANKKPHTINFNEVNILAGKSIIENEW